MSETNGEISKLMADLEEDKLLAAVKMSLQCKVKPGRILEECRVGIKIVGERFDKGDYYVSDLMMSGEIFKGVLALIEPLLKSDSMGQSAGGIVFGTVQGDIHNIGKDIVVSMLIADGFKVHDLGVDVPAEIFVNKVKETGAQIVGLSGLLTVAYDSMKKTVEAFTQNGMRQQVKVMVGGSMMNDNVCRYIGADAWGNNVAAAMNLARKFVKGD
jgi:methanogenic corrinoid protein MtbC1